MIHCGDCLEVMPTLPENSVDAVVTDPPYGLSFMGKDWDHGVPGREFWVEALRVAKPGAHLVAFGGTRTFHRLTCAIEDAGWEVRDCLSWLYGSGFPKSLDVSKAMDKAAGAEREVLGRKWESRGGGGLSRSMVNDDNWTPPPVTDAITEPATDLAKQWEGWGTALKPAWEPIILARKPLVGTVAANVTQHGTGGLNIDGCRIAAPEGVSTRGRVDTKHGKSNSLGAAWSGVVDESERFGRWPANVCLDEDAAKLLDAQSGERPGAVSNGRKGVQGVYRDAVGPATQAASYADSGGASRFFYCAKASRSEREAGLEGMSHQERRALGDFEGTAGHAPKKDVWAANFHPTVKPIVLMRWLCRLVTPPSGLILDPFTGSGTTGCAAVLEGFRFIGIEREPEYAEIARKRIAHHTPDPTLL